MNNLPTPTTKFAAAIFPFVLTILWSFQTVIVGGITWVETFQLLALVASLFIVRIVPLLEGGWAGAWKVLATVAGAVFAAIPPIIDTSIGGPGWTPETISTVVFVGVLALATQFGVDFRLDEVKSAIANPAVNNDQVFTLDPAAFGVIESKDPVAVYGPNALGTEPAPEPDASA